MTYSHFPPSFCEKKTSPGEKMSRSMQKNVTRWGHACHGATEHKWSRRGVGGWTEKKALVTDNWQIFSHQATKNYLFTKHNHTDYRLIVISCKFLPRRRRKEKPTIALVVVWRKVAKEPRAKQFVKACLSFIVITMEHRLVFHCFANLGDFWMFF